MSLKRLNPEQKKKLFQLLSYTYKYDITIQFWVESTNIYINKANVELQSYGGSFDYSVGKALDYLNRITRTDFENMENIKL